MTLDANWPAETVGPPRGPAKFRPNTYINFKLVAQCATKAALCQGMVQAAITELAIDTTRALSAEFRNPLRQLAVARDRLLSSKNQQDDEPATITGVTATRRESDRSGFCPNACHGADTTQ